MYEAQTKEGRKEEALATCLMSGQSKGIPQRQIGRGRDWSPLVSRFWDWDVKVGNGLGHR